MQRDLSSKVERTKDCKVSPQTGWNRTVKGVNEKKLTWQIKGEILV